MGFFSVYVFSKVFFFAGAEKDLSLEGAAIGAAIGALGIGLTPAGLCGLSPAGLCGLSPTGRGRYVEGADEDSTPGFATYLEWRLRDR